jgi:multicomponent Na+:H+ antiporter subunit F
MSTVVVIVEVVLGLAAAVAVLRLARGPSVLDRLVAMDMLLAVIVCGLAAAAAYTRDSTTIPVLVVVSLLGFLGSATVAGFLGRDKE